jgi:hypothetical protein
MATPTTSSTLAKQATQKHERWWDTTPGGAGATTAVRTAHRRRNPWGPARLVGRSARRAFLSASASSRRSTSTQGRRTLEYGSTITAQLGGATTDKVIIRNLPPHLADSARMWLERLPPSQIHNEDDLVRTFVRNFQGTYVRPGNSWDLRVCTQKPGESLRDFIRRFSKCRTKLPSVA